MSESKRDHVAKAIYDALWKEVGETPPSHTSLGAAGMPPRAINLGPVAEAAIKAVSEQAQDDAQDRLNDAREMLVEAAKNYETKIRARLAIEAGREPGASAEARAAWQAAAEAENEADDKLFEAAGTLVGAIESWK